jgi:hypothetical protein
MITRRTLEGALKCSLRLFLRLEWRWELIFVIAAVLWTGGGWVVGIVVVVAESSNARQSALDNLAKLCESVQPEALLGAVKLWGV